MTIAIVISTRQQVNGMFVSHAPPEPPKDGLQNRLGDSDRNGQSSTSNWSFHLRSAAFIILEAHYLVLGGLALSHPIPLHVSQAKQVEMKVVFLVISIVWQSLASLPIWNLVTQIFSTEWHFQFSRTGLPPRKRTNNVSTLDSDIVDYTKHFFSRNASWTFRIAVALSIALRLLTGVAPAAISVSVRFSWPPLPLDIANLTIGSNETDPYELNTIPLVTKRAADMSMAPNITFEFSQPLNAIVPTPRSVDVSNIEGDRGTIEYPTDVVQFSFGCEWILPEQYADNSVQIEGLT
ncbi:hypothetical protein BDQ17DRAFT_1435801 [Cyathus striatus]|nr:hypothetical protein BDQ17DRAFT_1435801 [Cyathus striatus]